MPRFDSTAVLRAEYDREEQVLFLWFSGNAGPYSYFRVPEDVFFALCSADSKGRFVAAHIRERYEYAPPAGS